MVVPEGFHVEVFAAEPMVRQPLSACFDERGRLWVIEYLQYPNPAGLKPVTVDQYLRTEYDKVPEPPPRGPAGADRIKILEDTDGDGRADSVKVFAEGLNLASALAVGHGGVFVGQALTSCSTPTRSRRPARRRPRGPALGVRSPGRARDGQLDDLGARRLALRRARGARSRPGSAGTSSSRAIWRYHPRIPTVRGLRRGGRQHLGARLRPAGNAFGSSNGAYITFHMVQGGYYLKGFAKHGPLHNPPATAISVRSITAVPRWAATSPRAGSSTRATPSRRRSAGASSAATCCRTRSTGILEQHGSTFAGRHGGTLIDARDRWFRPIDLLPGRSRRLRRGLVRQARRTPRPARHLGPHQRPDLSRRLRRTAHGPRFDLSKRSSAELVAMRTSTNDWFAAEARRILAERRDPSVIPELKRLLADDRDETVALRDLWALNVSGGLDDAHGDGLLAHPVSGVRRWTVRLLGDDHRMNPVLREKLASLAATEPDATVRGQLASSGQQWDAGDAMPILEGLARHDEDRRDPHIPNLLWWAVERLLRQDRDAVIARLGSADLQRMPMVTEALLERTARALVSEGSDGDFAACARLLAGRAGKEQTARLLTGMDKGLQGRKLRAVPAPLAFPMGRLWATSQPNPGVVLTRLAARMGDSAAIAAAAARWVIRASLPPTGRR